jgi:hypothetical protein
MNNRIPNFLIVGAAKCGTTALADSLRDHPEIYMSNPKELHYLSGAYNPLGIKGDSDYLEYFKSAGGATAIGEASVTYLWHHKSAVPKIKSFLGDAKILIVIRNPIERAFSDYMMEVRKGRESRAFKDVILKSDSDYVKIGSYPRQIESYLEKFSSVTTVLTDDLSHELVSTKICLTLGVAPRKLVLHSRNVGFQWRYPVLAKINKIIESRKLLKAVLKWSLTGRAKKYLVKSDVSKMSEGEWKILSEIYRDDIKWVENHLKRDLAEWRKYHL